MTIMIKTSLHIPDAVRFAANHVGISARRHIAPSDFLAALDDQQTSPAAINAVATFLNEADPAEIADLVACGATDFGKLATIAQRCLPKSHPTRAYLDQFAA
jgi:hypothetical protein